MVFLRLTIKIYPREQLQSTSSFSFRSILGDRGSDRDDATRASAGSAAGKPASFLLVLGNPEEVTLGGLAGMIQDKWRKLRPNAEPLQIKKLLDDDHESDDLDADMTVADVFVDNGLSQADARDQRRTVRVIQKPTPYAPPRFPSVSLDWDAAAEDYERQAQVKKEAVANSVHKFPAIPEEDSKAGSISESQGSSIQRDDSRLRTPPGNHDRGSDRRRDTPMKSVEADNEEIPSSPPRRGECEQNQVHEQDSQDLNERTVAATPQHRRMESQELGGSPTPTLPRTSSSKRPTLQRGAAASRGRSANRAISRMASEDQSPSSAENEPDGFQTPPGRRRTRSLVQHQVQQEEPADNGEEDESESESDETEDTDSNGEEEDQDQDGDVAMEDGNTVVDKDDQIPVEPTREDEAAGTKATEENTRNGDHREIRLGKRKMSQENLHSNKEPRLDKAGTPISNDQEKKDLPSTQETDDRRSLSPSTMRKPSFSRPGRRQSITDHNTSPGEKPGLGLGITRSPPRRRPVMLDHSSKTGELPSNQPSITNAPILSPDVRRSSSTQNNPTPAKSQTPSVDKDKAKLLPSALRKNSPADKRSERRSVSFSGRKDVIPDSGSKAESTPRSSGKEPNSTPMNLPPGISNDIIEQTKQEIKEKREHRSQEKREYEQKIREAKGNNADPGYLRILESMDNTLNWIMKNDNASCREKTHQKIARDTQKIAEQRKELERFEAQMNGPDKQSSKRNGTSKSAEKGTTRSAKKSNSSPSGGTRETRTKASARRQSPQKQTKQSPPADESPAKKPESTKADQEPALMNGHHPVDKGGSDQDAEFTQPQEASSVEEEQNAQVPVTKEDPQTGLESTMDVDESTQPQSQPPETQTQPQPEPQTESQPEPEKPKELSEEPEEPQVLPQVLPQENPQEQPEQPQPEGLCQEEKHSEVSKPPELQTASPVENPKKPSPASPTEIKPTETKAVPAPVPSQEQAKESSSEEESSSESESESESESDSSPEDDDKKQNNTNFTRNSVTKSPTSSQRKFPLSQPELQSGARFSSPLQRSQTPSQSQPQPQTQPFRAINQNSTNIRASLSGLRSAMHKQRDEHDARVRQARQASRKPEKDIFDPPSNSDSEDESESDSDSDSDSDSGSKSSSDEGDIQSSGTVGKLRRAISSARKT